MPELIFCFFFGLVIGLMLGSAISLFSITVYLDWLNK